MAHRVTEADLGVLEMLTGDAAPSGTDFSDSRAAGDPRKPLACVAALRRPAIDPLLLAASLTSNPEMTRHHFHHTFSGDAASHSRSRQMRVSERLRMEEQGESHVAAPAPKTISPPSQSGSSTPTYPYPSQQAPYSVRMQRKREQEEILREKQRRAAAAALAANKASLEPLEVSCLGRTRVPTPHGEIFVHLYRNNRDNKEHLALVADPAQNDASLQKLQDEGLLARPRHLRSRSLDAVWFEGETVMERLVRGAYVGRLQPDVQNASQAPVASAYESDQSDYPTPLVRIHSECYTGETIGSQRCDCGEQLDEALRLICTSQSVDKNGLPVPPRGVIVYMRQEGRGIGLLDKLLAYNLQDMGHDTVAANVLLGHEPDARRYDISSEILRDLGVDACRLLTNNPDKMKALSDENITVHDRVEMVPRAWKDDDAPSDIAERRAGATLGGASATRGHDLEKYLRTKVERMGHMLTLPTEAGP
ncbi:GTP cyclohydrolase II [Malassezia cuniculi]|uniref:GTP cyclohydrolase II n=1 Tax=Malassezia cuniculi TaxID=948313 RepID=A0AAF0J565_9BASI|nr:GTP cyclohydrolase II [Malassezia cuniculi]